MGGSEHHSRNELSGTVHGPAVQAQTIHGGIHIRTEAPSGHQPPWQLPPSVRITDRTAVLSALERHRSHSAQGDHPTLAAVSGLGGVGKTAVALAWLNTLRPHFPGGQLYADLGAQSPGGPADPGEVVGRFLRALGVPTQQVPTAFAERTALYRSLTAERRLVVLLDDAASAAQVRALLPGGQSVTAVTSRWRMPGLTVDGGYAVHLEPLTPEAALELLEATLSDGRVAAQPDQARALVELCAGLPLAVRVAGARLAARPQRGITTMVRALTEEHHRLEALAIEGDHNVRAALDVSYQGLPPRAARLYRLLGLHPGSEFGSPAATAVLAEDATDTLDLLYDANLLTDVGDEHTGEERYRFHDLVRLHALAKAEDVESAQERAAALRRIADHYLATATRAEGIIDPHHLTMNRDYGAGPVVTTDFGDDVASALNWLERELPNLMAVIRSARPAGFATVGWQLADALWPLFLRRKFYEHWRTAHAEGAAAARELGDTEAECRMLTSGGIGELGMESPERALEMFEQAARAFRATGNELGYARTLNYQGLAHQRLGRLDRAAEFFADAASELSRCGDHRAGGLARFNLADIALTRDLPREAIAGAEAAYTTLTEAGDTYNAARAATLLGRAHLAVGLLDQAEDQLSLALTTLRATASGYETARALGTLAALAEQRGQADLARTHCREALDLYDAAGRSRSADAEAARTLLGQLEDRAGE